MLRLNDLQHVRDGIVLLISLVLSIAVHEFGHAFVADKLGDRTPRYQGRVTLNPLVHADPVGTLLFPLLGYFVFGGMIFGWGKPVQINPMSFTRKLRMKTGHMIVALAGPAMNVVLALLMLALSAILYKSGALPASSPIWRGIGGFIQLNWILFVFNLIPCPPLDGGAVLAGLLPDRKGATVMDFLNRYGFLILLGLLMTGIVGRLLWPAVWLHYRLMIAFGLPLGAA